MLGTRDEVGECAALFQSPSPLVPRPTQLLSSTDVRDRQYEPAVQQAERVGWECRIVTEAVGPVAAQQKWPRRPGNEGEPIDQRDRHQGPIGSGGLETLASVERGVITSSHLSLLPNGPGVLLHLVINDRARSHQ